jgi:hypothetical protein
MAKVKKVSGVKFYMDDDEASALACLLRQGVENATLETLGLKKFRDELYREAYWKTLDFALQASLTLPDED